MLKLTCWTRTWFAIVGGLLMMATQAGAQELKPYFLVVVDTSGSMTWCANGDADESCFVNGDDTQPFLTNRCGFSANRIGDAKCALQRIIDGTGDAVFGLMQFEHTCSNTCVQPGSGSGLCDGQLVVGIEQNNGSLMREWVDGACQGTSGSVCTSSFPRELTTGQGTPIGESLFRANQYLRGSVPVGNAWKFPTNPDGFNEAPPSPVAGDPQLACRPVSVILLTDGANSCGRDPVQFAEDLYDGNLKGTTPTTKAFRTYVIGFGSGTDNYDPAALNAIAAAGDTDSPHPTDRFFAATNEAELSVALNQIIADSQAPAEICNMEDDDCDGKIDEGLPLFCNKPAGMNSKYTCVEPEETKCDGKDDDCDGNIDEDFAMMCSSCTSSSKEVCDGVDNDCDQKIDEDTNTMESCGPSKGACEPGELYCVDGEETCKGAVGPEKEVCDCADNDCDGNIDEDADGKLCGGDSRCSGCTCKPFCDTTAEFAVNCPAGLAAEFQDNGECLCIEDNCDAKACPKSTLMRDGKVACAPNDESVDVCLCTAGECAANCDGVMCEAGLVCNPHGGECVEDSCRGLGCIGDQICDPIAGQCVTDPCADAKCESGEVCRDGKCEKSCADVACGNGQLCHAGVCDADLCAKSTCKDGKICDAESGDCVVDPCDGKTCKAGQQCSLQTGECEASPCWNVTCPKNQECSMGECEFGGNSPLTPTPVGGGTRLLATGGGGCACSVPGVHDTQLPAGSALLGLGLLGVLVRRRRLRWLALTLLVLALSSLATGCKVTPFCVDCVQSSQPIEVPDGSMVLPDGRVVPVETPDGGTLDSSATDQDAAPEADGGMLPPGCKKRLDEVCNDEDDDCDFKVDEGVKRATNNCLELGVCGGTLPTCAKGKYLCRYPGLYEKEESLCDGEDNDCDGIVDEAFPKLTDNCNVGVGECRVTGSYVCNGAQSDVVCQAAAVKDPGDEICDGKDNDCDGLIDEPMSNPGKNPSYVDASDPSLEPEICDGKDNDCDGVVDEPKTAPGSKPSYVVENMVQVNGSLYVYKFEASRVDATDDDQGNQATRACSREGVLPWTNLTYAEAVEACTDAGLELCKVADWIAACDGTSTTCDWAFTPTTGTCDDYTSVANGSNDCNGHDIDAAPGDPDDDALAPTGTFPRCFADFPMGDIFDMSGNAKEWTTGPFSPTQNPLRGGSYNNSPTGLRCDFDFTVGGPAVRLPNIGFRCCSATAP